MFVSEMHYSFSCVAFTTDPIICLYHVRECIANPGRRGRGKWGVVVDHGLYLDKEMPWFCKMFEMFVFEKHL